MLMDGKQRLLETYTVRCLFRSELESAAKQRCPPPSFLFYGRDTRHFSTVCASLFGHTIVSSFLLFKMTSRSGVINVFLCKAIARGCELAIALLVSSSAGWLAGPLTHSAKENILQAVLAEFPFARAEGERNETTTNS